MRQLVALLTIVVPASCCHASHRPDYAEPPPVKVVSTSACTSEGCIAAATVEVVDGVTYVTATSGAVMVVDDGATDTVAIPTATGCTVCRPHGAAYRCVTQPCDPPKL